jgi:hypothetical protein
MTTTAKRIRRGLVLVLVAAVLVLTASAAAQSEPPSAVAQYVEMVPTAKGPAAPGNVNAESATTRPPTVTTSTDVVTALEEIATSPIYGAPSPAGGAALSAPTGELTTNTRLESAGALATASVSDARLVALLVAILVTTLGAVALAIVRARQ